MSVFDQEKKKYRLIYSFPLQLRDMKLSNQDGFEKHLRQAAPNHFASVYGALFIDRFDRLYFADKFFAFLRHYKPGLVKEIVRLDGDAYLSLASDLFTTSERLIVIDHLEKLKKGDYPKLIEEVEHLNPETTVLLLGESFPTDLYHAMKSDIILLDLLQEKPWEKKRRLIGEIIKLATRHKRRIEPAAVELLVESLGLDLARLKSELEKLVVFTEGSQVIETCDVRKMTLPTKEKSYWHLARDLIAGELIDHSRIKDLSDWLIFAGQVRTQLMAMAQIAESLEKKKRPEVEGMREKEVEKLALLCQQRSLREILELIDHLFQCELDAKEEGVKPDHLLARLVMTFAQQVALK